MITSASTKRQQTSRNDNLFLAFPEATSFATSKGRSSICAIVLLLATGRTSSVEDTDSDRRRGWSVPSYDLPLSFFFFMGSHGEPFPVYLLKGLQSGGALGDGVLNLLRLSAVDPELVRLGSWREWRSFLGVLKILMLSTIMWESGLCMIQDTECRECQLAKINKLMSSMAGCL